MGQRTWEQYYSDITKLIECLGVYRPDVIVPCMLGGLIPEAIMAKQLGIKMYTIGIGSEHDEYIMHPFYGPMAKPKVNADLLKKFAQQTGGQFFMARNAQDMRTIYEIINKLETTEYETPIYSKYYDIFMPFLWIVLALLLVEVLFSTFVWFSL